MNINKLLFLLLFISFSGISQESPKVKHVLVIGFDGLSPDGLAKANTPTFDKLIREGASSMHGRSVLPTSSSTNWATMIMGAGPEQHGITSNAWEKNNFTLPTVTEGEDFLFPTIFRAVDMQIPNAEIGAIYDWGGFGRLFEKSAVDYDINPKTEDETAKVAAAYIRDKQPTFTFIHFDHVDHAGHEYGHGTQKYYESVEKADALLAEVLEAVTTSEMGKNTVLIVSADHGGLGKGHGGESMQEMEIPFIVWGKSVKQNTVLDLPIYQYDNAATVAFAFGIKMPLATIGRPVKNAFEGFLETDAYTVTRRFAMPLILPKAEGNKTAGGLFKKVAEVHIENPNSMGEIRYTTDGTRPTKESRRYTEPFSLSQNTVVKSAVFNQGSINSMVNEAFFRVIPENMEAPVSYEIFYLSELASVPFLGNRTPDEKGNCYEITSDELKDKIRSNTAVRFKTNIRIDQEDSYVFFARSDDGSLLKINAKTVVDNDGDHGVKESSGKINLKPGVYPMEVLWFNGEGDGWLDVYYQSARIPKQILPSSVFKSN